MDPFLCEISITGTTAASLKKFENIWLCDLPRQLCLSKNFISSTSEGWSSCPIRFTNPLVSTILHGQPKNENYPDSWNIFDKASLFKKKNQNYLTYTSMVKFNWKQNLHPTYLHKFSLSIQSTWKNKFYSTWARNMYLTHIIPSALLSIQKPVFLLNPKTM